MADEIFTVVITMNFVLKNFHGAVIYYFVLIVHDTNQQQQQQRDVCSRFSPPCFSIAIANPSANKRAD